MVLPYNRRGLPGALLQMTQESTSSQLAWEAMLSGVSTTTKSSSVLPLPVAGAESVEYSMRTPALPMQMGVMVDGAPLAPAADMECIQHAHTGYDVALETAAAARGHFLLMHLHESKTRASGRCTDMLPNKLNPSNENEERAHLAQ